MSRPIHIFGANPVNKPSSSPVECPNQDVKILAVDERNGLGIHSEYLIECQSDDLMHAGMAFYLVFRKEDGGRGLTEEALLSVVLHRLKARRQSAAVRRVEDAISLLAG